MMKNNFERTSNDKKECLKELKWWKEFFKEAQIMKKNVQNSSKDEKESLNDVK